MIVVAGKQLVAIGFVIKVDRVAVAVRPNPRAEGTASDEAEPPTWFPFRPDETGELVEDRPVLRQFNALHLNDLKGAWTWFADAYAIILAFLAVSGLVMLKGRLGFAGRGKWLFALGLIVPIAFIVGGSY